MIPIALFPKRFRAALNKTRLSAVFKHRGFIASVPAKSIAFQPFSTQTLPAESDCSAPRHSTSFQEVETMFPTQSKDEVVSSSFFSLFGPRPETWWTGKSPRHGCPGSTADGRVHSLPMLSLKSGEITRQGVLDYFDNTWTLTEALFACLQGEEAFTRPPYHDLRHPMIFYYGHPAVFYINKLRLAGLLSQPLNLHFEDIFEVGVDEMSWDDLSKNKMPWPSVQEVHAYRKKVHETVTGLIKSLPDAAFASVSKEDPLWALVMATEHERIHIETSSVLISEMPLSFLQSPGPSFPAYHPSVSATPTPTSPQEGKDFPVNDWIAVDAREVTLGKPDRIQTFGWDNEYGSRTFPVPAFQASKFKITNGEYLAFVKDGGYSNRSFWTEDGWKWRAFRNSKWPFYWVAKGPQGLHQFDLRLLFDVVPMPWNWPVAVNRHESIAFANWKAQQLGKPVRIMTELEHHCIRDEVSNDAPDADWDPVLADPAKREANVNLRFASMSPVDAYPANQKGFHDVHGNAWEWTMDNFCALPGFEVHPFYEDFSTPCFDGLHNVIQSSSFVSTGNQASVYSRYHFRPHFLQHASFRIVQQAPDALLTSDTDAPGPYVGSYPYRRSREGLQHVSDDAQGKSDATSSRRHFHFSDVSPAFMLPPSLALCPAKRVGAMIVDAAVKSNVNLPTANVLEIGCGPGGVSLFLASQVHKVVGLDHHHEDVMAARAGAASAQVADRAEFRCADPMCVPAEMSGFDVVVVSDVLDKVASPNSVLGRLGSTRGLVKPGGLLVVSSAYRWNELATPRGLWIAPAANAGSEPINASVCAALLADRLNSQFELIAHTPVPLYWQQSDSQLHGAVMTVSTFRRRE